MVDTIPADVLHELKETFSFFEREKGDGIIPNKSLGTALRSMGLNPTEVMLKAICDANDQDGSSTIKLNTFLLVAYQMQMTNQDSEAELRDAFKVFAKEVSHTASPNSRPVSPSYGPTSNSPIPNESMFQLEGSFANGRHVTTPQPVMSVEDLRAALMNSGEKFDEADFDELLRELDLMPGDSITIEALLRIVALKGVEHQDAASTGRRRARTTINASTVGGHGRHGPLGSAGGTNRGSRAVSVAQSDSHGNFGSHLSEPEPSN